MPRLERDAGLSEGGHAGDYAAEVAVGGVVSAAPLSGAPVPEVVVVLKESTATRRP